MDHPFPEGVGEEQSEWEPGPAGRGQVWYEVLAVRTGYLQGLDTAGLLAFAGERATVVRMEREIGEFVIEGTPLASMLGASAPSEEDKRKLGLLYAVGRQRTVENDAAFGIRQIVDVALKALSPGVNDTTTAVMCIDYLTAILVRLSERGIESHYRGEDGELRLLTLGPTYSSLLGESFDQIRRNASGNVTVLEALLGSLELLADRSLFPLRRSVLMGHVDLVAEMACRTVPASGDQEQVENHVRRVRAVLGAGEDK